MLKRLILCHKINKFYKTFGDVLGWTPGHVNIYDLSNNDCLMSIGFDIAETLEGYDDPHDAMTKWLNKLYKEVI